MNLAQRIIYIIENNSISPSLSDSEFARNVGTYSTKISELKSGKVKSISSELALEISKKYLVNIEWLITGEGGIENAFQNPYFSETIKIPQKGEVECAAGEGCFINNEKITDYISFDKKFLKQLGASIKDCSIIKVKGDSMYPTLNTGDKVLVDLSQKEIIDGKIYVLRIENMLKVKRLHKLTRGKIEVISDNKEYRIETLEPDKDSFEVCGRVLWHIIII